MFKSESRPPAAIRHPIQQFDHSLHGIEILRFVCALVVIVYHYQHFMYYGSVELAKAVVPLSQMPFYWSLQIIYEYGLSAVLIFWTISGFIFFWRYGEAISAGKVSFAKFGLYRFSRLYPLHLVTLVLVSILQFAYFRSHNQFFIYFDTGPSFLKQLFFASSWLRQQGITFNGPVWSVSVEIIVYCLFFLVARLIGARPWIAVFAATILLGLQHYDTISPVNPLVWQCGGFFFAGGVAYWVIREAAAYPFVILIVASATASVCFFTLPFNQTAVMTISFTAVITFAMLGHRSLRKIAHLGNATYSSYVCHFPIQLLLVLLLDALGQPRTVFFSIPVFVGYLALVLAVSLGTFHYFERPAQAFIRSATASWI